MGTKHEVRLNGPAESGGEEWECTTCSYRIAISWPPAFQYVVLDHGEPGGIHIIENQKAAIDDYGGFKLEIETLNTAAEDEAWLNDLGLTFGS